jgi:hypothetical protein
MVEIALEADTTTGEAVHPHRDERIPIRPRRRLQQNNRVVNPIHKGCRRYFQPIGAAKHGASELKPSGKPVPVFDTLRHLDTLRP